ncbi:hypothetical protein NDU88_007043 [Pleurodeles waltl]|uniref:Uncharacterized protein n=1 Tax=Pleurodeles waltl TaxID=8319 RepID=A0AAV7U0B7_PLEWA|nr:hypothetical protein NDU88_007043 [Pleurodeles waltl]
MSHSSPPVPSFLIRVLHLRLDLIQNVPSLPSPCGKSWDLVHVDRPALPLPFGVLVARLYWKEPSICRSLYVGIFFVVVICGSLEERVSLVFWLCCGPPLAWGTSSAEIHHRWSGPAVCNRRGVQSSPRLPRALLPLLGTMLVRAASRSLLRLAYSHQSFVVSAWLQVAAPAPETSVHHEQVLVAILGSLQPSQHRRIPVDLLSPRVLGSPLVRGTQITAVCPPLTLEEVVLHAIQSQGRGPPCFLILLNALVSSQCPAPFLEGRSQLPRIGTAARTCPQWSASVFLCRRGVYGSSRLPPYHVFCWACCRPEPPFPLCYALHSLTGTSLAVRGFSTPIRGRYYNPTGPCCHLGLLAAFTAPAS